MKIVEMGVIVVALCCAEAVVFASPDAKDGRVESALVVVTGRFFEGQQVGNGFVVGDGTLVVTCDHLVSERSEAGGHCVEGLVSVFSPYLGQACDARILASDEELDLAVLETSWKGHPSLTLGDANAVLDAKSARIIGLSAVLQSLENREASLSEDSAVQAEELPVAFVAVRERIARFVTLSGAKEVGVGWSGSPIVLPGTSTALGCFSTIHSTARYDQNDRREAVGAVAPQVQRLLSDSFDASRLRRAGASLSRPEDAWRTFMLALHAVSSLRPDRYEFALEPASQYL
ncbi:MAG: S1 family peptidase, partial [Solirubrobacterales bacterium]